MAVMECHTCPDVMPSCVDLTSTSPVVERLAVPVLLVNPDGCFAGANQAWTRLSGLSLAASQGRSWWRAVPAAKERARLLRQLAAGSGGAIECRLSTPAGSRRTRWVWGVATAEDEARAVSVIDLAAGRAPEEGVARIAAPDPLAEVTDRQRFLDLVEQALRVVDGRRIGVVYADLEGERVDHTGDHVLGERALRAVVGRLRQHLRPDDVLGRVGGGAFAVLCTGPPEEIVSVESRLVAALHDPIAVEGRTINVRATIGVAVAEGSDEDPEALLGRAGREVSARRAASRSEGGPDHGGQPQVACFLITVAAADRAIRRTFLAGLLVASCHTRVDHIAASRLERAIDEMDGVVKELRSAIAQPGSSVDHGTCGGS